MDCLFDRGVDVEHYKHSKSCVYYEKCGSLVKNQADCSQTLDAR